MHCSFPPCHVTTKQQLTFRPTASPASLLQLVLGLNCIHRRRKLVATCGRAAQRLRNCQPQLVCRVGKGVGCIEWLGPNEGWWFGGCSSLHHSSHSHGCCCPPGQHAINQEPALAAA